MDDLFFTMNDRGQWTQHNSRKIPLEINPNTLPFIWWKGWRLIFDNEEFGLTDNTFHTILPDDPKLLKLVSMRGYMNFEEMCKIWKGVTNG